MSATSCTRLPLPQLADLEALNTFPALDDRAS
jgi:hypothetical protein